MHLCFQQLLPPVLDAVARLVEAVSGCERTLPLARRGAVEVILQT